MKKFTAALAVAGLCVLPLGCTDAEDLSDEMAEGRAAAAGGINSEEEAEEVEEANEAAEEAAEGDYIRGEGLIDGDSIDGDNLDTEVGEEDMEDRDGAVLNSDG